MLLKAFHFYNVIYLNSLPKFRMPVIKVELCLSIGNLEYKPQNSLFTLKVTWEKGKHKVLKN